MPGPEHEVSEFRFAPGQLSFRTQMGGHDKRVSLRTDGGETARSADAALAACLMPAMRSGGTLTLSEPVSPRLLRTQREFQAVQRAWSHEWGFGDPPLEEVEVAAPTHLPDPPRDPGRVAAFFSGGVDSWSTLLGNPEITDLIFVRGIDLLPGAANHAQIAPEVEARIRRVAEELDLTLHVVETDLREFSDPLARWEAYYGCACIAVAHFLAPRFERVLLASGVDHEVDDPIGSARLIDHLWSTEQLEVVDDGGPYSRVERTRRIAKHPLVQRTLRVCWENRDGAYNCGHCRKCLMTMITFEAIGARSAIQTFPPDLDLADVAAIEIKQAVLLTLWEDVLDVVRAEGRADLEPAVEEVAERGKRRLNLPLNYRRRALPGPPPLRPPARRFGSRLRRLGTAIRRPRR
jgi:hypothetical protein